MLKELSIEEFTNFSRNHNLGNFHQTIEYALLRTEEGFEYELIGYYLEDTLKAASLILYKKINNYYYGYAPRGFLIDYSNKQLLKTFTEEIIKYYQQKSFIFIKINPEIAIGTVNQDTKSITHNQNYNITHNLIENGYKKLKDNLYFEALLPRMNVIIPLNKFSLENISKNTRNKVKKGIRKGLTLHKADNDQFPTLYEFIKNIRNKDELYYKDLVNVFDKNDSIDLFLVKVDFKNYLINSQAKYNEEMTQNTNLNDKIMKDNKSTNLNAKMNSDKKLLTYKNDITEASKNLNTTEDLYIAGALVIKYENRITIQISGYDKNYKRYSPNYFLYYAILDYYKATYKYADLNGITADFSANNPYHGLNRFKIGFNPDIYEYIGEYDLIINQKAYNNLLKNGTLAKEFNKQN